MLIVRDSISESIKSANGLTSKIEIKLWDWMQRDVFHPFAIFNKGELNKETVWLDFIQKDEGNADKNGAKL